MRCVCVCVGAEKHIPQSACMSPNAHNDTHGALCVRFIILGAVPWASGIGEGRKDEANLTGYWRFSEGKEGETVSVHSAQVMSDLSAYSTELVALLGICVRDASNVCIVVWWDGLSCDGSVVQRECCVAP